MAFHSLDIVKRFLFNSFVSVGKWKGVERVSRYLKWNVIQNLTCPMCVEGTLTPIARDRQWTSVSRVQWDRGSVWGRECQVTPQYGCLPGWGVRTLLFSDITRTKQNVPRHSNPENWATNVFYMTFTNTLAWLPPILGEPFLTAIHRLSRPEG